MYGGSQTAYAPEGAFTIKYILLELPDDDVLKQAVTDTQAALSEADAAHQAAFQALALAAYDGKEDLSA